MPKMGVLYLEWDGGLGDVKVKRNINPLTTLYLSSSAVGLLGTASVKLQVKV